MGNDRDRRRFAGGTVHRRFDREDEEEEEEE